MEEQHVSVPMRYEIYSQSITNDILNLRYMGYNKTLPDAQNMCRILGECDRIANGGLQKNFFFVRAVIEKGGDCSAS